MPLNPRPLHPAEHPADEARAGFRAWSQHVEDLAPGARRVPAPQLLLPGIDFAHPLAKVVVVAFIGYTLGRLFHRRK